MVCGKAGGEAGCEGGGCGGGGGGGGGSSRYGSGEQYCNIAILQ